MTQPSMTHGIVVVERTFPAEPARVFATYANVASRSIWGVGSPDDVIVYDAADLRTGGSDSYRCGSGDSLTFSGTIDYYDIVEDTRIVYVETVTESSLLSVSLVTWELLADGCSTRLVVTDQVASYVGSDMIDGTRHGTQAALGFLADWLAKPSAHSDDHETHVR